MRPDEGGRVAQRHPVSDAGPAGGPEAGHLRVGDTAGRGRAAAAVLPANRRGHPGGPTGTRPGPRRPAAHAGPAGPPGSGEPVMRGERWLLHVGEFLVGRAARHLPAAARDLRCQEWAAELPVILGDPETRPAAAR